MFLCFVLAIVSVLCVFSKRYIVLRFCHWHRAPHLHNRSTDAAKNSPDASISATDSGAANRAELREQVARQEREIALLKAQIAEGGGEDGEGGSRIEVLEVRSCILIVFLLCSTRIGQADVARYGARVSVCLRVCVSLCLCVSVSMCQLFFFAVQQHLYPRQAL